MVRWALDAEALDMLLLDKLHAELLTRSAHADGVLDVQTCAAQRRVVIEIDQARMAAYALAPEAIEAALREGLAHTRTLDIEQLRSIPLGSARLADLAAIRYGFGEPQCVAAGAHGLAVSATYTVADAAARARVDQLLDSFAAELPAGVRLLRFGDDDTIIDMHIDPGLTLTLTQIAESIGGGLTRESAPWLVEVGLAAGSRARLSLHGRGRVDRDALDSFRSIPGVSSAELAQANAPEIPTSDTQPSAAQLAVGELEIGTLLDDGVAVPVVLRIVASEG